MCQLAMLLVLAGCTATAAEDPASPRPALTVSDAVAEPRRLAHSIEVQGQIAAWQEAVVSARNTGLPLVELTAAVGDVVRRGQLLARMDARTVEADLAQAKAQRAQADANLAQAVANRDRTLALKGTGAVSDQEQLQATTTADAARAQRDLAAAAVKSQSVRLEDCAIRAIDDGVISSRSAGLGMVPVSGTELFRLIRRQRLEWRAELTAEAMSQVHVGMAAAVNLPDGTRANGRVRQLSPALDGNSRLGLAYVDLEVPSAARAGMFASGRLDLGDRPALAIPAESVVIRDGRSVVFKVVGDRVAELRIATGRRQGAWIEVTQGLQAGERVVVRGAAFLTDKDKVRIATQPPAPVKAGPDKS